MIIYIVVVNLGPELPFKNIIAFKKKEDAEKYIIRGIKAKVNLALFEFDPNESFCEMLARFNEREDEFSIKELNVCENFQDWVDWIHI